MVRRNPLVAFFALTFAITWGVGSLAAFASSGVVGEIAFYVAVYGPTISALVLTIMVGGVHGLKKLLGRIFKWRVGLRWYLVVLVGVPLSWALASLTNAALGGDGSGFDSMAKLLALPVLLFVDPGPFGEEPGWRGFALPRLLERFSALSASVVLGLVWAAWHLPVFVLPGFPQSGGPFLLFAVVLVAQSILMTWIFAGTGGSVLVAGVLWHLMVNSTISLEGGSYGIWVVLVSVTAVAIVAVTGPKHLSRHGAASRVS